VEGELDLSSADGLGQAVADQLSPGGEILLDLSQVGFIDSTGLAAVLAAVTHAGENAVKLEISSTLQPQPLRLLELTGVLGQLPLADRSGWPPPPDSDALT
jgi:anti-sigma B factor antagonist